VAANRREEEASTQQDSKKTMDFEKHWMENFARNFVIR
jgi:hypothetical protein